MHTPALISDQVFGFLIVSAKYRLEVLLVVQQRGWEGADVVIVGDAKRSHHPKRMLPSILQGPPIQETYDPVRVTLRGEMSEQLSERTLIRPYRESLILQKAS